jgi:hypothetical protein
MPARYSFAGIFVIARVWPKALTWHCGRIIIVMWGHGVERGEDKTMIEQIKNAVALLLIVGLASMMSLVLEEPLSPLLRFLDTHESVLLVASAVLMSVGFVAFMGTTLYVLLAPRPPAGRSSTAPPITYSGTVRRRWNIRMEFQTEASFGSIKAALRTGDWRRDPQWRVLFIMMAGALVMAVGLVSLFLVVAPLTVKLIMLGAAVYAVAVVAWGFAHA